MSLRIVSDPAIEFIDVSVRYRVPKERLSGIKEYTIRWLQRRILYSDFWALQKVSFAIQPGEVFGIMGRNGAGKSTLLKVMAQVLRPVHGRVIMRGRVAPLLELGGGFHPELTGRENVYMNMALLGHAHSETDQLFDSILEFAELQDFIDAPLRTYSTGMIARLGFSVATCTRPDILLVDEVLSVGDSQFQQKCLDRMADFQRHGTTIVIVSHSLGALETLCRRALWLDKGRVMVIGGVEEVVQEYIAPRLDSVQGLASADTPQLNESPAMDLQDALRLTDTHHETKLGPVAQIIRPVPVEEADGFVLLPEMGVIYPAEGIFSPSAGSVLVWMKIHSGAQTRDAVIFHTNDSRYILYISLEYSSAKQEYVRCLVARAGGNRRVIDTYYGTSDFPEARVSLEQGVEARKNVAHPLVEDVWHLVVMTWEGYPDGKVCLLIDGEMVAERAYNTRYDRGDPLPEWIATGWRPPTWRGEVLRQEDGALRELRPDSVMAIEAGGIETRGLRIYQCVLSIGAVQQLLTEGME